MVLSCVAPRQSMALGHRLGLDRCACARKRQRVWGFPYDVGLAVFFLLVLDVIPYHLLISSHCRDKIPSRPKVLAYEVALLLSMWAWGWPQPTTLAGTLELANHPCGGLVATLTLPRDAATALRATALRMAHSGSNYN
jgi:hypothetical protein